MPTPSSHLIAVALGGALGASGRFGLSLWLRQQDGSVGIPLAVLTANLIGAFLIGCIWVLAAHQEWSIPLRLFLIVGVLGGFTTFSTLSLEALLLWQSQVYGALLCYLSATMIGGLVLTWGGFRFTQYLLTQ